MATTVGTEESRRARLVLEGNPPRDKLRELAKSLGISGYSPMTKSQLTEAIRQHLDSKENPDKVEQGEAVSQSSSPASTVNEIVVAIREELRSAVVDVATAIYDAAERVRASEAGEEPQPLPEGHSAALREANARLGALLGEFSTAISRINIVAAKTDQLEQSITAQSEQLTFLQQQATERGKQITALQAGVDQLLQREVVEANTLQTLIDEAIRRVFTEWQKEPSAKPPNPFRQMLETFREWGQEARGA